MNGSQQPGSIATGSASDDLSDGSTPAPVVLRTVTEVLGETRSRRNHRLSAAILVYGVVGVLATALLHIIHKLAKNVELVEPAAVGMVASLIIAITVLTISLVRFAFANDENDAKKNDTAVGPPTFEAVHKFGEMISQLGDVLKGLKP